ncbi:Uncharacterized protein Fot_00451 [Forsythia ovata]|uniref:Uncharacterized protein n=1 Tax=Forsythia ovata TaxID=205694 RepID=A0ABD1X171_9LAMI
MICSVFSVELLVHQSTKDKFFLAFWTITNIIQISFGILKEATIVDNECQIGDKYDKDLGCWRRHVFQNITLAVSVLNLVRISTVEELKELNSGGHVLRKRPTVTVHGCSVHKCLFDIAFCSGDNSRV